MRIAVSRDTIRILFPLVAVATLVGCATLALAPMDIGTGNFAELYTAKGNILVQAKYRNAIDCERTVRARWGDLTKNGSLARCSSIDHAQELPHRLVEIKSDYPSEAVEFSYYSQQECESNAKRLKGERGNYSFNERCASSGNYLQIRASDGTLFMQGKFKSEVACGVNARKGSANPASKDVVSVCSWIDLSERLPYRITNIKTSDLGVAQEVSFATSEFCDSVAMALLKQQANNGNSMSINMFGQGKIEFTDNCSTPTKPTTIGEIPASPQTLSPSSTSSAEAKLRELKRLYDAGLVSNEIYTARQKTILESSN